MTPTTSKLGADMTKDLITGDLDTTANKLARQPAAIDKPVSAEYRCRKCGDAAEIKFSYARTNDCCRKAPCERPGKGPCDMPARQAPSKSISDAMMDLVDRLGHEWKDVDPRAWDHLLVYAPSVEQDAHAHPFAALCDLLPSDVSWGDPLTPDIARHIARAASTSANVAQGAEAVAWREEAQKLFTRCKLWPEKSDDGFMALLELRNHVEKLLKNGALTAAQSASGDTK